MSRDRAFGVMHVFIRDLPHVEGVSADRRFDEVRDVLTSFSLQAAAALANARMHEELQHTADVLEERVRERTVELEAANKELEAFSYSVSHDLRAPLRAVDGFTRIALMQYGDEMNDDCRKLLESVRCGAAEMNALITSLLTFSRSARQHLHVRPVVTNDIVASVLDGLQHEMQDREIEVVVGDLPDCQADPVLLKQVYANLLSNALKFTAKRSPASVEVGSCQEGAATVYHVRDNGAGFDPSRADRLFGVFQRLHRAEEYPGNGVGLATVQRIVVRHGGRIWCEAAPEQGATFYFTLGSCADASPEGPNAGVSPAN